MQAHDWPGNARELVNRVRRVLVTADGRQIQEADLDLLASPGPLVTVERSPLRGMRMRTERDAIEAALKEGKSVTMIARELGVSRMTFYRLMGKHGHRQQDRARPRQRAFRLSGAASSDTASFNAPWCPTRPGARRRWGGAIRHIAPCDS
jgi:hypothetical protein